MAGPRGVSVSLVLSFIIWSAVAERPSQPQEQLHLEHGIHSHSVEHSSAVGAKGANANPVARIDDRSAKIQAGMPREVLASVRETLGRQTDIGTDNRIDCSDNLTAPDHDTTQTCSYSLFKGKHKETGEGAVCDPVGSKMICAIGYCAEKKKCVPRDGNTISSLKDTVMVLRYGATAAERAKAAKYSFTKAVGDCGYFHCDAKRAPDQLDGGGVGCNHLDDKCYCLQPGYFASESEANWKNKGNKCIKRLDPSNDFQLVGEEVESDSSKEAEEVHEEKQADHSEKAAEVEEEKPSDENEKDKEVEEEKPSDENEKDKEVEEEKPSDENDKDKEVEEEKPSDENAKAKEVEEEKPSDENEKAKEGEEETPSDESEKTKQVEEEKRSDQSEHVDEVEQKKKSDESEKPEEETRNEQPESDHKSVDVDDKQSESSQKAEVVQDEKPPDQGEKGEEVQEQQPSDQSEKDEQAHDETQADQSNKSETVEKESHAADDHENSPCAVTLQKKK